ncbi:MAG: hypothetical protein H8E26_14250 [FCB group bacterium]|nr:hypothetical protein [FCB group bacterium]MBL7027446.1 hypothetical protein [Candidatus Neomarinimicrobiota bacterium]MBL7122059.1 hypothetical protein [Candidatus Neomarinimicrobiota bacterium]
MRLKKPNRLFFVYRIMDKTKFTDPVKSESSARRSRANLQKHFDHELAVGWQVMGQDGKPQTTEYPK